MERNRWETAIRCLEIAVHPNTSDEEIIAAVNGFRRTADATPLSQLWREFIGAGPDTPHSTAIAAEWKDKLEQLSRENLELRLKVEEIEADRTKAARRLQEADERARDVGDELLAAEHRAAVAERRLAEFQGAYGRISGGLRHENSDLRQELEATRRTVASPVHEAPRPFQHLLNAARQRLDQAQSGSSPLIAGRPWTA
jgi:hypothetical protein